MNTKKRVFTSAGEPVSEIGKLPPQAVDLEEVVLGAMLLEKKAVSEVIVILKPESFYKEQNGTIYKAILSLWKNDQPVDILTVTQELKRTSELEFVGGSFYISALTNRIASSANIEFHARLVQQKFLQREMIRIGTSVIKSAYEPECDVFELISQNDKELLGLLSGIYTNQVTKIGDIVDKAVEDCRYSLTHKEPLGVLTPNYALNLHTSGWQKSTFTILAARPSMGKSAFALDCAYQPAKKGKPTAFFSLEMSKAQLANRLLSAETSMPVQQINNRQVNQSDVELLEKEKSVFKDVPLYIEDNPILTISTLRQKAKRLVEEFKVELIVIDYLQLMTGDADQRGNRESEISKISRGLKLLSRELDIPIIALSQLSRKVEERGGLKKPMLSDLRESGSLEQDADNVIFMYRPAYYEFKEYVTMENGQERVYYGEDVEKMMIFIIAKFRNGGLGEIKARWIGHLTKVEDWNR